MNVPNYQNTQAVDKNGYFSSPWQMILNQLLTQMQNALSDEGFVVPSQSASEIAKLTNSPNGTLIYDSTNNLLKVKIGGTFRTVTTS